MKLLFDEFCHFFNRFASMAELIFLVSGHFRKGLFITRRNEYRIVAKSCFPLRFHADTAFYVPHKGVNCSVRKHQRHTAYELGAPLVRGYISEFGEQFFVILRIVSASRASCIPGGVNSRRPVQRIHLKPGVVGQGCFARKPENIDSLLDRVPLKSVLVLNSLRTRGIVVKGQDRDRKAGNDPLDLFDLFLITGGENYLNNTLTL